MSATRFILPLYALKSGAFFLVALACGIAMTAPTYADSAQSQKPDRTFPYFKYSESSEEPIIEYNLVHDMLAEPDTEPMLRIYGNGLVHVHYPAYMVKAGDYELQLSKSELNNLIRQLAEHGIFEFDRRKAIAQKNLLEKQKRASSGQLYHISDDTATVVIVRLDEYQGNKSGTREANALKLFSWKNIDKDTRRYPNHSALQNASKGIDRLRSIINRSDLKKIK